MINRFISVVVMALVVCSTNSYSAASDVVCTGCIDASDINGSAVTTSKIKRNAVTSGKIKDGTIIGADIAGGAVNTSKIKGGAVTTAKINGGAVTEAKLSAEVQTKLNEAGPQGIAGADGADGATGPQGPQGPAGLDAGEPKVSPIIGYIQSSDLPNTIPMRGFHFNIDRIATLPHSSPPAKPNNHPMILILSQDENYSYLLDLLFKNITGQELNIFLSDPGLETKPEQIFALRDYVITSVEPVSARSLNEPSTIRVLVNYAEVELTLDGITTGYNYATDIGMGSGCGDVSYVKNADTTSGDYAGWSPANNYSFDIFTNDSKVQSSELALDIPLGESCLLADLADYQDAIIEFTDDTTLKGGIINILSYIFVDSVVSMVAITSNQDGGIDMKVNYNFTQISVDTGSGPLVVHDFLTVPKI